MRRGPAFGWMVLAGLCSIGPCRAADPASASQPSPPADAEALDTRRRQLQDAMEASARAEATRRGLQADLDALRAERSRLASSLIETTGRVRDVEGAARDIEKRLEFLTDRVGTIRRSLQARRAAIAEILAALQRMGLHPLPALLASPDDMLRAIRTSMLLGAVVPEMRGAAEALADDLTELTRLRAAAAGERDALAARMQDLGAERVHLAALVATRQSAQAVAEGTLEGERSRAADLARRATGLQDLVAKLEGDVASARRAADAARAADEARRRAAEAEAAGIVARAAAGTRDPARLAPAQAFAAVRGQLTLPVSGTMIRAFGAADGYGGQERGISLTARPGAVVTAPADGWISYAGPYRSYGQLLIVNAGDGYYMVLAGLARTDVVPGQFVLTGEPLGAMGDGAVKTASSIALGAGEPVLYVEFRKDGAAIDPSPWWAKAELEKVRR